MNDRELDLLIQHVFGDAEGAEAAEAAKVAANSPQDAKMWAELKSDLRALNDVPECQMSVDRLQHAILNSTQKTAVKGWSLAKVFGGFSAVAAGAFALVLTMNMQKQADPVSIVGNATPVAMSTEKASDKSTSVKKPSADTVAGTKSAPINPAPVESESSKLRGQQVVRVPRRNDYAPPSARDSEVELVASGAASEASVPAPGSGSGMAMAAAPTTMPTVAMDHADSKTTAEDSVVILGSSTNVDGTRQAVEVSRNEDVVFGG